MTPKGCKCLLVTVGALLLGLAVATSSWAQATVQGLYYREFKKDGRYFVFNNPKAADAFEKSGETGVGLTRVAAGPNGESVFADNETALELFFFKHGISQEVERPKSPTQRIEWRDGKTRMTLGSNFYLEMSNRVQVRYTHELPDDAIQLPGTAAKGDSKGSFRIRRAKFKLEGFFWKPYLTYEVQMNWPAAAGSNIGAFLEDAAIDWDLTKGKNQFRIHFGQFKVPYGRQELTSSGSQQFVDRTIVSNQYARGRDTGIALWGQFNNKIEWRVGAFNGNGLTRTLNDNDKFQYNARVMWQIAGNQNLSQRAWVTGAHYSEADFESTDKPIVSIAANFESNNFHGTTANVDLKDRIYGGDLLFKYKGFSAVGEYWKRKRTPETGSEFHSDGWFGQGGFLLGGKRQWEVVFRYAEFDPSDLVPVNKQKEIRGGLNYYYQRHNLKVQADYGQVKLEGATADVKNDEFRLQTQFIF